MKSKQLISWLVLALVSCGVFVWCFPRVFQFLPKRWVVSRGQAVEIALERLRDLGDDIDGAYVEASLDYADDLGYRLFRLGRQRAASDPRLALPRQQLLGWEVLVYAPGRPPERWSYRVRVGLSGQVDVLRLQVEPEEEKGSLDEEAARFQADRLLTENGFDLASFESPTIRSEDLKSRTDRRLLYRLKNEPLGEGVPYGLEVGFAGQRLTGFEIWIENPDKGHLDQIGKGIVLAQIVWRILPFLLLPVALVLFVRRYHEGEIGVRRGSQLVAMSAGLALLWVGLCLVPIGSGTSVGDLLSRAQASWMVAIFLVFTYCLPIATLTALGWSLGEVLCRDRWPGRLAAFDALFQGAWKTSTVAAASFRGFSAGLALSALNILGLLVLARAGFWVGESTLFGPWWDGAPWMGLALWALTTFHLLYSEMFFRLMTTSALVRRLGPWLGGALAAIVGGLAFFPRTTALPMSASIPLWILDSLVLVVIFMRYGVATSLLTSLTASALLDGYALISSGHPGLVLQGSLPLFLVSLPLMLSIRHLSTGKSFEYRYDDVPPHVRRIAERERQRVELETARRIQSSILPDLPPQLHGVEIAHSYLPASEVGGDFYDVLALEDGRLAVAVGDVAGHGVSSGLVMSMARSALAVQVTFNPAVEAVFATLNRVVFQSARKRLLATLCYAVLDPARRELQYASAGHLYPYVVTHDGRVDPLEYVAYPLGVRSDMVVEARLARLGAGDVLFLLSDGLIEARAEGSEEMYGFERLEQCLSKNSRLGVFSLRDAVLADVNRHTRNAPRDDDQTVLVLRLP